MSEEKITLCHCGKQFNDNDLCGGCDHFIPKTMNKAEKYFKKWECPEATFFGVTWTKNQLLDFAEFVSDQETNPLILEIAELKNERTLMQSRIEELEKSKSRLLDIIRGLYDDESEYNELLQTLKTK